MNVLIYAGCAFVLWAAVYGLFFVELGQYEGTTLFDLCVSLFRR